MCILVEVSFFTSSFTLRQLTDMSLYAQTCAARGTSPRRPSTPRTSRYSRGSSTRRRLTAVQRVSHGGCREESRHGHRAIGPGVLRLSGESSSSFLACTTELIAFFFGVQDTRQCVPWLTTDSMLHQSRVFAAMTRGATPRKQHTLTWCEHTVFLFLLLRIRLAIESV